ncbi:MAG TPA: dihydroxyacetone kinase phosphoryl donor subunit DhaM [Candidatus Nanopelagicales bacterium]|nr:dihydroxyacetone kinase phosphoryl donor subunit DhaM [Candidatus Nanopelagicales bacterium]
MEPLVGIVVVSHSAQIAAGTVELARQMAGDDLRIEAAGGTADGSLGTDAAAIMAAIVAADGGAGVLVLMDLGSAVLATQTALEMLGEDVAARVRLSRGPLVEGAVVAAVQASVGDDLAAVLAAAEEASSLPKIPE